MDGPPETTARERIRPGHDGNMRVFVEELRIILDAAERLVHMVLDLSAVKTIDDTAFYTYYSSSIPTHPRQGRIGLVNANFRSRAQADMLNRSAGRELFHCFALRHAARDFLLAHNSTPPLFPVGYDWPETAPAEAAVSAGQ